MYAYMENKKANPLTFIMNKNLVSSKETVIFVV